MCVPESNLRDEILDYISVNSEAHFKSQQIEDPELTVNEKRTIAENILNKSTTLFLSRFGQYLSYDHLQYFTKCSKDDEYIVQFYLQQNKKQNSKLNQKLVRNRRFEAMNQLIDEGSYFSESEMKSRNPLLYEQLIGQYLSPEEREEANRVDTSNITFVNLLLQQIDKDSEESFKQEQMETEKNESTTDNNACNMDTAQSMKQLSNDTEVEYDTSDEEDDAENKTLNRNRNNQHEPDKLYTDNVPLASKSLWGEVMSDEPISKPVAIERTPWATSTSTSNPPKKSEDFVELSDSERCLLFEEFRSHMLTNFLEGKEEHFDYSKVDSNPAYDNLTEKNQDAEDKYFDEDESSNSEMQVDIEPKRDENTSSEDELDVFMKKLKPEILIQDINSKMKHL